ncbi:MAG: hypothetical protein EZS28_049366 [Streblomastix strix]|uniref:Uncharacterized protein n=1 Tax=Streblomastix strix TaxID=222440 RepID=A0A5J4TA31_9EUKA|nr:MAG: hypothetical protein EZS28_049366 [Streblomastix strix]
MRTRKSGPSQPASRPILRNRDGTRTIDSIAGDVYTNLDHIIILLRTIGSKTVDITTIPGGLACTQEYNNFRVFRNQVFSCRPNLQAVAYNYID